MTLMAEDTQKEEKRAPSVKVGEQYRLVIAGFGKNGDPFVSVDKYILFLKPGKKGKPLKLDPKSAVDIKVTKILPKLGFAEIVEKEEVE